MFQLSLEKIIEPANPQTHMPFELDVTQEVQQAAQQQNHQLRPMDKFDESSKWEDLLSPDGLMVFGHHYDAGAQGLFATKNYPQGTKYALCNPLSEKIRLKITISQS